MYWSVRVSNPPAGDVGDTVLAGTGMCASRRLLREASRTAAAQLRAAQLWTGRAGASGTRACGRAAVT